MDATINQQAGEYRVELNVFQGPLDLLLYLIQKEEVDIYDIPIAKITGEYLKYIELMSTLNLEIAGEFILMAAMLIRIKTKMLLPRSSEYLEEPDPREELITALIEYKKYKQAGEILRGKALQEERNYVPPPVAQTNGTVRLSETTTLFDLLTAFRDLLKNQPKETFHEVSAEEITIEDRIVHIMRLLREKEFAVFNELFADSPVKVVAVVTFIALLELARARRVTISQSVPFAELRVYRGELFDAPRQTIDIMDYHKIEKQVAV
ncbi:MAG: segregation and condensation protein A [Candidatus Zixiibacteriota bacterium]